MAILIQDTLATVPYGSASFELDQIQGVCRLQEMPSALFVQGDGPYGDWARKNLYGDILSGIRGKGLLPAWMMDKYFRERSRGLTEGHNTAQRELGSNIRRAGIPKEDLKVQNFLRHSLQRRHTTGQDNLKTQRDLMPAMQTEEAMGMGFNALAGEKQIGAQIAGMQNRSSALMSQIPTMSQTGFMGASGGMGWLLGNMQPNPAQTYGKTFTQGTGMPSGYMNSPEMWNTVNNWMTTGGF